MRTRVFVMFGLVVAMILLVAVWTGATLPSAAQEPEPSRPTWSPPGSPPAPDSGPRRAPDGAWYMAVGAEAPTELPAFESPRGTGGPDDFGYTWDNAVPFAWIDATSGTDTGMGGCMWGTHVGPISLPFSFNFYGTNYDEIYIAAAGYMAFSDDGYWPTQQNPMPSQKRPNNVISPFWTIICLENSGPTGRVYYRAGGTAPNRYFVVEWFNVKGGLPTDSSGGDESYRFEAILYESGDILFQYDTMIYNDWRYYASIGIEDELGLDGLGYMDWGNYWSRLPASSTAVRFLRPTPRARVKVWPLHDGSFTSPGEATALEVLVHNTGELGADTYELFVSSPWLVGLYAADGTTWLIDTDGDGSVDTGSVAQGGTTTILVKVSTPGMAGVGDGNSATITIASSLNPGKSKTVTLQTAVPAPFAQIYQDDADGALSLYLVQPAGQAVKKASSDWYYGGDLAVAEMPGGFAYLSNRFRTVQSRGMREIEYALLDHYGRPLGPIRRLTDHSGATINTYDYDPAVAVAPNGRIGVVWYRYLYDSSISAWNYNVYYSVLDASGTILVPPTNLTNNLLWGSGSAPLDVPEFWDPRIAATTDNRFVLAWSRYEERNSGAVEDIFYAIRGSGGEAVRPVTQFTSDTPGWDEGYYYPNLAQLSGNRVLFVWCRSSDSQVYYAVLDSDGNTVKAKTSTGGEGWAPDAVQLSNGNSLIAWTGSVGFVVLNSAYNRVAGPTTLSNPAAITGDAYPSVAADSAGHAILTWMDSDSSYRRSLYYALLDSNGTVLTGPMVFRSSQAAQPRIFTSYGGYGNTSYSWTPPSDVDGVAVFGAPVFGAPPGGSGGVGVRYANHGSAVATSVVLTATLDSNLVYAGDTSGLGHSVIGNDVVWSLPDLGFLADDGFRLYIQVPSGAAYGTRYPVTLTLASGGPEVNPGDNSDSAEVMVARQVFLPLIARGY